jgi:hypothetical protein
MKEAWYELDGVWYVGDGALDVERLDEALREGLAQSGGRGATKDGWLENPALSCEDVGVVRVGCLGCARLVRRVSEERGRW